MSRAAQGRGLELVIQCRRFKAFPVEHMAQKLRRRHVNMLRCDSELGEEEFD